MNSVRDRRRRAIWRVSLALLAALTGWIAVVAAGAVAARNELEDAAVRLRGAQQALRALDVDTARPALTEARDLARSAGSRMRAAHVRALAVVPGVGHSLRTGRVVAEASASLTARIAEVTAAVAALPGGADALQPRGGRLPVETFEALAEPLARAAAAAERAEREARVAPTTWLLPDAREGRADLLALLDEVRPTLEVAAGMTRVMPGMLGADEPRRYLLLAANPAELRGVGGFPGAHAVARVDDGRLDIGAFRPIWELERVEPGTVPAPSPGFAERYEPYGGTWSWLNQNLTPDFPSGATMIERLWAAIGNEPVDGTILVDPFAFQNLLRLTGDVDLAETGKNLRVGNVVDYVTNGSFADLDDPAERKDVIGEVAASTLQRFLGGRVPTDRRTIRILSEMFAERHVVVHATDPEVQAVLARAGVAGRLRDPDRGVFVNVTLNSGTASKVDYWLDQTLRTRVTPLDDGAARVEQEVVLRNGAPTEGEPRQTIGPNDPALEAGENRLWVSVYCGDRCEFERADPGTSPRRQPATTVRHELGQPVASTWVDIPAGETVRLRYRWLVADAWWLDEGDAVVGFTYQAQSSVRPRDVELDVEVPATWTAMTEDERFPEGVDITGQIAHWGRTGRADADLTLVFTRET